MKTLRILWVDDEIDHLKPFVLFLQNKGYEVITTTNGTDAIAIVEQEQVDLVLLDEMMPGLDGLSTLKEIKKIKDYLPVVMVTKSEEEGIMDNAIAGQIADYLIKPINPNQIILAMKKIFEADDIRRNRIGQEYAQFSARLMNQLYQNPNWQEWARIYRDICHWDIQLDTIEAQSLSQTHFLEKKDCNAEFATYVTRNYRNWLNSDERPNLSFDVISEYLAPQLGKGKPVYFVVIDCMRLDQYLTLEPMIQELFDTDLQLYYSILPTATPYSRNSIFSGLLPVDIAKNYPEYWVESGDLDNSRNRNEHQLLDAHLADLGFDCDKTKYVKIFTIEEGNFVVRKIDSWKNEELVILVYNFLDLLAHHRSKSQILKETIPDEKALRAFTKHWFQHSTFYEALKLIARQDATIVLTTDHGSIRVNRASQLVGDKDTTSTVRYKEGRNLKISDKHSLLIKEPAEYGLPPRNIVDNYAITKEDYYFVYPNAYHQYMKQYNGTFQHGGISMEEMILPVVVGKPKK